MASGSTSKTLIWILMALLIFGLGGFGITNISGNLRKVGSVGDTDITVNQYVQALRNEMNARQAQTGKPVSFAEARDAQLDQIALARIIATTALDNEAARLGISVGDENLRDQLLQIPTFQGLDGKFDREAYKFYLDRTGESEAEFERGIRSELSRGLLQSAVLSGLPAGDAYADTLVRYLAERRDFTWARLSEPDLAEQLPDPTEDELKAFHESHAARFTLPERKRLTYAWLSPDMILDQVEVDEAAIRDLYNERSADFVQPERRLVERLGFPDEAAAEQAKIAIEDGSKSFEDLVTARGLELADVDMGDVSREDLGAAGAAVFSADTGTVVGPFATDLGPALFRVNGILAAHEVSFEEARDELRDELAQDRARRRIDGMRDQIDDLLAAGATLEEVTQETDMQPGTIDWTADSSEGPAGYTAFQEEAAKVTTDDYPALIELDDGGLLAMRLDEVLPPALQPLDSIREDVVAAWEEDQITTRLAAKAETLLPEITPETDMAALGLTVTEEHDITRQGFIEGTPPDFIASVFTMKPGEAQVVSLPMGAIIVRLDAVNPPDADDEDVAGLRNAIRDQVASARAQDLYQYFVSDVQSRAGLQLDQRAIDSVNSGF